jgi:hypothetical protein
MGVGGVVGDSRTGAPELEERPTAVSVAEHDGGDVGDVVADEQFPPHEALLRMAARHRAQTTHWRLGQVRPPVQWGQVLQPYLPRQLREPGDVGERGPTSVTGSLRSHA